MAHHLAELFLNDQTYRMGAELAGQNTVKGGRSAATLQMSQNHTSYVLVNSFLQNMSDLWSDPTKLQLQVV